jgi:hypothetical protein
VQGSLNAIGVPRNHSEVCPSWLVRPSAALLPIPQSAEWNVEARGKFLLSQSQSATKSFDASNRLQLLRSCPRKRRVPTVAGRATVNFSRTPSRKAWRIQRLFGAIRFYPHDLAVTARFDDSSFPVHVLSHAGLR